MRQYETIAVTRAFAMACRGRTGRIEAGMPGGNPMALKTDSRRKEIVEEVCGIVSRKMKAKAATDAGSFVRGFLANVPPADLASEDAISIPSASITSPPATRSASRWARVVPAAVALAS